MARITEVAGEYFYGNKISKYGIGNGYVDYDTLARGLNIVLNNEVINCFDFYEISEPDDDDDREIFQWYITDATSAKILCSVGERVFYEDKCGIYL